MRIMQSFIIKVNFHYPVQSFIIQVNFQFFKKISPFVKVLTTCINYCAMLDPRLTLQTEITFVKEAGWSILIYNIFFYQLKEKSKYFSIKSWISLYRALLLLKENGIQCNLKEATIIKPS